MNDTRTALIVTGIFPPDIGGPATYVPKIASYLVEKGHRVIVITLSEEGENDSRYAFTLIRIPRKLFKPIRWLLSIFAILRFGLQADLLYVNGLQLEAVQANLLLRKPLIMKVVGDVAWERALAKHWTEDSFEEFQTSQHGLRIRMLIYLRSWWTRRADKVITPSKYLAKAIALWDVPPNKITVVYNAVQLPSTVDDYFRVSLRDKCDTLIITVGRLIPLKQIDKLLEAVAQLKNVGLLIVGDGVERPKLESLAKHLNIERRVSFLGRLSHQDTISAIRASDALVLYSTHEGLPHVVLEAAMLGKPIIATAVGGTPEVLERYPLGKLISPTNQEELLSSLLECTNVPARAIPNATDFLSNFDEATMLEKTAQILFECI